MPSEWIYDEATGQAVRKSALPVGAPAQRFVYDERTGEAAPAMTMRAQEADSIGRTIASGAAQGASSPFGLLDLARRGAEAVLPYLPGGEAVMAGPNPPMLGETLRERYPLLAYEPQGASQRYLQAGIRGPVAAAANAPMVLAAGPIAAGALLASGATGELSAQAAHEANLGPMAEIGAGIIGSLGPSLMMSAGRRIEQRVAGQAGARAAISGEDPNVAVRAARELKARLPGGRVTADQIQHALEQGDTAAAERLRAAQGQFGQVTRALDYAVESMPEGARVTTAQALSPAGGPPGRPMYELGGEKLGQMENLQARVSDDFGTRLAAQKIATQKAVEERIREAMPQGDPRQMFEYNLAAHEAERAAAKSAYEAAVPLLQRNVDAKSVAAGVQNAIDQMRPLEQRLVPREILDEMDRMAHAGTVPVDALDDLASFIKAEIRRPSNGANERRVLGQVVDSLENSIDDATRGNPALYEARAAWRQMSERYNPPTIAQQTARTRQTAATSSELRTNAAVQGALEKGDDFVRGVLNPPSGTSAEAMAREIQRRFGKDSEALASVERGFVDHILGDTLTSTETTGRSVQQALSRMRDPNLHQAYRVLFGEKRWKLNEQLLRQLQMARFGSGGTTQAIEKTASGELAGMFARVSAGEGGVSVRGVVLQKAGNILSRVGNFVRDSDEVNALIQEALLDPKVARDLLRIPTGRDIAAWEERMRSHVARAVTRQAAIRGGEGI